MNIRIFIAVQLAKGILTSFIHLFRNIFFRIPEKFLIPSKFSNYRFRKKQFKHQFPSKIIPMFIIIFLSFLFRLFLKKSFHSFFIMYQRKYLFPKNFKEFFKFPNMNHPSFNCFSIEIPVIPHIFIKFFPYFFIHPNSFRRIFNSHKFQHFLIIKIFKNFPFKFSKSNLGKTYIESHHFFRIFSKH